MSQGNVDILRRDLEAAAVEGMKVNGLDHEAVGRLVQVLHPEVEFREDPTFPEGGVYHGRDAVRDYFKRFSGEFEPFWWEAEELVDADRNRVLALIRVRGRGKGSGAEFDTRGGWLFTFSGGKAVRVDAYLDRREAFEAAGLSEARGA
jgi:ketosteroid isomerase-like protein